MKNQIKIRIEDYPFTNISKHTINDKDMLIFDEDINRPEERFNLAGYKTEKGIRAYYILNSDTTQ